MKVPTILSKIFAKEAIKELNEEDSPKALQDESRIKEIAFGITNQENSNKESNQIESTQIQNINERTQELSSINNSTYEIMKLSRKKKKKEEVDTFDNDALIFEIAENQEILSPKKTKENTIEEKSKNEGEHYLGHRSRLRQKITEHGPTALKDYELLELLLTYSIPRADTKPLAKNLLEHFKTLQTMFLADRQKLSKVKGIGESTLCFFSVIHEICCRIAREEIANEVLLNSPEKVINYCRLRMAGLSYEQFRVLFLNRKNKLISDETLQSGTIDKAAIFPRELVKRAIEVGAGAIILVHNHPSGDPTPSKADIESTINVQKAANLMEIYLYDHIIIGRNTHYSMRSNKII